MKVVYSEAHRPHRPPFEIWPGGEVVAAFEVPERVDSILAELRRTGWAEVVPPEDFGLEPIRAVHAPDYVDYLQTAFADWRAGYQALGSTPPGVLLGSVFPPRGWARRPVSIHGRPGYYSFDLSCAIGSHTWDAALAAAHCALTGAGLLLGGAPSAFALCRPPGHHAGRDFAGGYCYLNNAAIAAAYLSGRGRTAILDVDYHAGNGTQDIFYASPDVLTISLHADPAWEYPYFVGHADESGAGAGSGFHRNFPLPPGTSDDAYLAALAEALALLRGFGPDYLVLSLGVDGAAGDPLSQFHLTTAGYRRIGTSIAGLGLPTLVVMEGGYDVQVLGRNVVAVLSAFEERGTPGQGAGSQG